MKKALIIIVAVVLVPLLWVGGNLIYGTLTDFQPPSEESLTIVAQHAQRPDSIVRIIDWNIGYCGLGEESDFFYDGGSTVRMDKEIVRKNLDGVLSFMKNNDSVDVFLLQEVDTLSKRSWGFNEYTEMGELMPDFNRSFALNYNVNFVPVPFLEPMGKVMGGLATFNRLTVTDAKRKQLPSSFPWPNSIYFLDRCLMVQRVPYNEVELVIVNAHNSAYDEDGTLKKAEMDYLKDFLKTEEEKGNYVIVGGDWNQHAPGTGEDQVPSDFLEGWTWAFDTSYPTNRDLKAAYVAGETKTQVIDFYLCSPNVKVEAVRVLNLDFKFSDHQPVYLRAKLKG